LSDNVLEQLVTQHVVAGLS